MLISERFRNLEDMLFLAYFDKTLGEMEKKTIVDFAKQLGITQEQINIIREKAQARFREK